MPEAITTKQDATPAFSPEDQAALSPDDNVVIQGEEKQLLAGKYKSVEELERGYRELQDKLGRGQENDAGEEPDQEATTEEQDEAPAQSASEIYGEYIGSRLEESGVNYADMSERFAESGSLSDEDYGQLEAAGFTRQMVDAYLQGLQYQANADSQLAAAQINQIKSEFGGEKAYQEMVEWAKTSLSESEISAFNKLINTSDMDQARLAVSGLYGRYTNANGREPKLMGGRAPRSGGEKFESTAQVVEAMSDPKYQADPAFRRKVQEKLARSNVL